MSLFNFKMKFLIFVMALMMALAAAAPASPVNLLERAADGTFTLPVHRKTSGFVKSPAQMVLDTVNKYRKRSHWAPRTHFDAIPSTVCADPTIYDQEYLAPIHVGGQPLAIDIDTGSSDLWVFSTLLSEAQQANHSVYNPAKSGSSHLIPNSSWAVQYGDGSAAQGVVYTDCVWVGDTAVEGQGVEAATYVTENFVLDSNDGILGLGFDSLNNAIPPQKTFMTNAIHQGLPAPVFTADLHPNASGSYDFGFIDESKYSGDLVYSDVIPSVGFWLINMTGWSFGSGANQTTSRRYTQASVVDTGTSIVFLTQNIVRGYWATVPGSTYSFLEGGYVYPCGTELPDFTIAIGAFNQTIPGKQINYSPSAVDPANMCFGGIQSQAGLPYNILGDLFLKNVFAVFDQSDQPKVGFAAKA